MPMKSKRIIAFILVFFTLSALFACSAPPIDISGKTFVYEGEGFGGDFTITLEEDGRFHYYEGMLSSYIGHGEWELDGDILTITDEIEAYGFVNRFKVTSRGLKFIAEGSDNFLYLDIADGEYFYPKSE